jgi:PAS domain S-box-containing protein
LSPSRRSHRIQRKAESTDTEQSAAAGVERLAGIVRTAKDAIVVVDGRLRIVVFNAAAERMFGLPAHAAIGGSLDRVLTADGDGGLAESLDRARADADDRRQSYGLRNYRGLRGNGESFRCEASIATHGIDGHREYTLIVRDISEREPSEDTLQQRIEFETFLFDLSSTFIGLPDEKVDVHMVQGFARVGEFLKMDRITLIELAPDRDEMIVAYSWSSPGVPAPAPRIDRQSQPWFIDQVRRGAVSLARELDDLPDEAAVEKEYLRRRGVVSAASIPLKVGGAIAGAMTFITVNRRESWLPATVNRLRAIGDILWNALKRRQAMQARLAAEVQVRESEERFRLIASTAPVIIWMSDPGKRGTFVSESWTRLTGHSLTVGLGDGWMQWVHPDDLAPFVETYSKAFDQRVPFRAEYRLQRPDGEFRWMFAQGVPRYDAQHAFAGYIGSTVDITERKAAEEVLSTLSQRLIEAQEQERARLARELHDDINQRLAVHVWSLESIKQRLPDGSPELEQQLGKIIEAAATLTKDVQRLSHRLHSSNLQMLGLEVAAQEMCRELAEQSGTPIEFRSEGMAAAMPEDLSVCLYRVLQEAVQNALKHSGSSHLAVSLARGDDAITLTVQDAGTGFEPGKALNGRGLGLISMKERLRLVDGLLTIETRSPGGTTIRARVPLQKTSILSW